MAQLNSLLKIFFGFFFSFESAFLAAAFAFPFDSPLLARTSKLELQNKTLYFTCLSEQDLLDFEKTHAAFNHEVEIISIALVNQENEIVRFIVPPAPLIFPFVVEKNLFCQINTSNSKLTQYWKNDKYRDEDKEAYLIQFIRTALENPLGELKLASQDAHLLVEASIEKDSVLIPLECVRRPVASLFAAPALDRFFGSPVWRQWDQTELIGRIQAVLSRNPHPELKLKKTWFLITTDSNSKLTEAFARWLGIQTQRERGIAYNFILHSHFYPVWKRFTAIPQERFPDWSQSIDFALLPSLRDWEGNILELKSVTGMYVFDEKERTARWAFYPVNSDLYYYTAWVLRSIQPVWDRNLTVEEYFRGKSAFEAVLKNRARTTRLPFSEPVKMQEAKTVLQQRNLERACRKLWKKQPRWAQEISAKLRDAKNKTLFKNAADTWDLFMTQHSFNDSVEEKMLYLANRLRYLGEGSAPFSADDALLEALDKPLNSNRPFSSLDEIYQEIESILLAYLNNTPPAPTEK